MIIRMSKPIRMRCHPDGCDMCPHRKFCPDNEEKQQGLDEDYIKDENFVS